MPKLKLPATLLAVAALALLGCASAAATERPLFPVTIEAANGTVRIAKRPTRIVSLSPTATEDLYAVGAGRQVIAVDEQSDFPKRAPRTKLSGFTPNVEAIAGYRPDLVVVHSDASVAELERLGITVLQLPAAGSLAHAYAQVRQIGRATGHPRKAASVIRWMRARIAAAVRSVQGRTGRLTVYHELTTDYYSATSGTFIGQIYKLLGLRNIADAAGGASPYPKLAAEYVIAADPDVIVLADSKCCGQSYATVAARPGWDTITAVRERRVVAMDDDVASRWGPRVVAFVRAVAAAVRRS
ncbi:MAG: ABC transporter substrate-binding protein [Actinomycetota bacterium]|nr:ABC transporter substrate-binding protein [Actinomycetota bacterium]